jgi:hypothetical protein
MLMRELSAYKHLPLEPIKGMRLFVKIYALTNP